MSGVYCWTFAVAPNPPFVRPQPPAPLSCSGVGPGGVGKMQVHGSGQGGRGRKTSFSQIFFKGEM